MPNGVTRAVGMSLLALGIVCLSSPKAEAGFVGTATITGKVTNASGQVITGGKVVVQVCASATADFRYPFPRGFWGQRRVAVTNSQGIYTATVGIPDGIAANSLYAWVIVAKMSGPPIYLMDRRMVSLAPLPTPGGTKTYSKDFVLQAVPYGAFVQGTVRDAETGERLRGAVVSLYGGPPFMTDAEGYYFGVVPLSASSRTINYYFDSGGLGSQEGALSGISYLRTSGQATLTSGQSWTKDVELAHAATQTAIVGRLTDSRTGNPVPHETVYLYASTTPMGSGVWWGDGVVTDLFGRYDVRVDFLTDPTNGQALYLTLCAPASYYVGSFSETAHQVQCIDVSSQVREGEVVQQDFSLVPN